MFFSTIASHLHLSTSPAYLPARSSFPATSSPFLSPPDQRPNKYLFPFERHEDSLSSSFDLPSSDRRSRIPRAAVSSLPRRCGRRLAVRELLRKSFNEILESRSPKPFVVVKLGPTGSIRLQDEYPSRQEEEGECAREKRAQVWADTSWYVGESLETR